MLKITHKMIAVAIRANLENPRCHDLCLSTLQAQLGAKLGLYHAGEYVVGRRINHVYDLVGGEDPPTPWGRIPTIHTLYLRTPDRWRSIMLQIADFLEATPKKTVRLDRRRHPPEVWR